MSRMRIGLLLLGSLIAIASSIALSTLTTPTKVVHADKPVDGVHNHDNGDEEPALASIDLLNCNDGAIAKWPKTEITFEIDDVSGVGADVIEAVRQGVVEWNGLAGNPHSLGESTGGDINTRLFFKIIPGSILGAAGIDCSTGTAGIQSASIVLGVKGLREIGLQNLSAHEIGHTLGLGHSDKKGDLMDPRFEHKEEGKRLVCPSNLNTGGLTATVDPYSIDNAVWQSLLCE